MTILVVYGAYKKRLNHLFLYTLMFAGLAACVSSPSQMVYVLDAPQPETVGTKSVQDLPTLEVGPVILPDYLDTTDIVRRSGAQVVASSTARWGDRLSKGLQRSLAGHIAREIPRVVVVTNLSAQGPLHRLLVDVQTFEAQSENEVKLTAHWTLLDEKTRKPLMTSKTVAIEKIQDASDAGIVDAMNRAVIDFSKQIATQITEFVSKSPKIPL